MIAVFLGLKNAFDTVNHKILFQISPNFGIKNIRLKWIESYLNNRKQMVVINNIIGHEDIVEYVVPQGSVRGPILFVLYINLVSYLHFDGSVVSYADLPTVYRQVMGRGS